MPTKPLDRLLFAQGNECFFCKQPLSRAEASVEHLLAASRKGSSKDENCVACCKAVNALLGSMTLKEKFQVVLNQKGKFKCPNGAGSATTTPHQMNQSPAAYATSASEKLNRVIDNLRSRKSRQPQSLKALKGTIASLFPPGLCEEEIEAIIEELKSLRKITIMEKNIDYSL